MARCRSSAAAKSSAPYLSCNTVRAMAHHLHDALDGSNCRFSPDAVAHVFHPPPPTPSRHPPTPTPQPPTLPAAPELASPPDPGAAYMHAPTRGREEGGGGGRERVYLHFVLGSSIGIRARPRVSGASGASTNLSLLSLSRARALSPSLLSLTRSLTRALSCSIFLCPSTLSPCLLSPYPLPLPPVPTFPPPLSRPPALLPFPPRFLSRATWCIRMRCYWTISCSTNILSSATLTFVCVANVLLMCC